MASVGEDSSGVEEAAAERSFAVSDRVDGCCWTDVMEEPAVLDTVTGVGELLTDCHNKQPLLGSASTDSCDDTCSTTHATSLHDDAYSLQSDTGCCARSSVDVNTLEQDPSSLDDPCAICESRLQASFAERTAHEMTEILKWWKTDKALEEQQPRNSLSHVFDEDHDQNVHGFSAFFCHHMHHFMATTDQHGAINEDDASGCGWPVKGIKIDSGVTSPQNSEHQPSSQASGLKQMLLQGLIFVLVQLCPVEWVEFYSWTRQNLSLKARRLVFGSLALGLLAIIASLAYCIKKSQERHHSSLVCYPRVDEARISLEYEPNNSWIG